MIEPGGSIRIGTDVLHVRARTGTHDGVVVLETEVEPGGPAPLDHVHEHYDEVFHVVDGSFQFRVGDEVVRADNGAVVTVPRGTAHTFKNCGETSGRVLIIGAPGRVADMLEQIGALVTEGGVVAGSALAEVYDRHHTRLVAPLGNDG